MSSISDFVERKAAVMIYLSISDLRWIALRRNYIFPEYSPPFPLLTDLISSFHPRVQASLDPVTLTRAVALSNLATFVWTVLQPDEAGDVLMVPEDMEETLPRGGGERQRAIEVRKVRGRNRMMLLAWKKFWMVVVPREKRTSETGLRLWLDFATQVRPAFNTTGKLTGPIRCITSINARQSFRMGHMLPLFQLRPLL